MEEKITKAIAMLLETLNGEKLEDDEKLVGVFNDGVVLVGLQEDGLHIEVVAGKPSVFDFDLGLDQDLAE